MRMPSLRKVLRRPAIFAAILAAGLSACSREDPAEERSTEPTTGEKAPVPTGDSPEAEIPLDSIGLVDPQRHEEPPKAEWRGETFNDLAGAQLKALGKVLEHPDDIDADALGGLLEEGSDTDTTSLVPASLEVVFEDSVFRVQRPPAAGAEYGNADNLPAALGEFVAPFAGATDMRSKAKIFSVELEEPTQPACEVYFQISATVDGSRLARRVRWQCEWSWPSADEAPKLRSITALDFEETSGKGDAFGDIAAAAFGEDAADLVEQFGRGIDHWAARIESRYGIGLSGWHGIAVGDANGDGLDDVYICEPGGLPNRLLIHAPGGGVIDASAVSGTDFRLQTQSAIFVDLDNDGDQDLALATTLGVLLMENDGRANFTVKVARLIPDAAPLSVSAADFDLDGDLDLYYGCYTLRSSNIDGVQILGRPIPYHDANNGGRNSLDAQRHRLAFLRGDQRPRARRRTTGASRFAASWEDYDDDGDPDLYVANDYGRNNLYRNDRDENGDHTFTDVAAGGRRRGHLRGHVRFSWSRCGRRWRPRPLRQQHVVERRQPHRLPAQLPNRRGRRVSSRRLPAPRARQLPVPQQRRRHLLRRERRAGRDHGALGLGLALLRHQQRRPPGHRRGQRLHHPAGPKGDL